MTLSSEYYAHKSDAMRYYSCVSLMGVSRAVYAHVHNGKSVIHTLQHYGRRAGVATYMSILRTMSTVHLLQRTH